MNPSRRRPSPRSSSRTPESPAAKGKRLFGWLFGANGAEKRAELAEDFAATEEGVQRYMLGQLTYLHLLQLGRQEALQRATLAALREIAAGNAELAEQLQDVFEGEALEEEDDEDFAGDDADEELDDADDDGLEDDEPDDDKDEPTDDAHDEVSEATDLDFANPEDADRVLLVSGGQRRKRKAS